MTSSESDQSLSGLDQAITSKNGPRKTDDAYAWLVAVTSFLCHFVVGAIFYSFSLFYIEFVEYFQTDKQTAGWVGSVYIACFHLSGLVFSSVVIRYGCRVVAVAGALVVALGLISSSFASSIITLYFTFGVVAGTGSGMIWLPSVIIIQRSFTFRRSLAAGISLTGFPIGIIVGTVLQRLCIDTYGWKGTVLLMGAVALHCCAFGMSYRPNSQQRSGNENGQTEDREEPDSECTKLEGVSSNPKRSSEGRRNVIMRTAKELCSISLLSEVAFILFCMGTFCMDVGMIAFSQHNPSRAVYKGVSVADASLLPLVNGISDAISRTANGLFGNMKSVDRALQYGVMILMGGILEVMFVFATKFEHFVVYTIIFGFLTGGFLAIQQTVQVDLFGLERIARSQALLSLFVAVGCLLTTPFAGFLFDATQDYDIPFYVTGSVQVLGGIVLVALAINNRRRGKPNADVTDDVTVL